VPPAIIERKLGLHEIIVAELEGQLVGYLRFDYLWSVLPYIAVIFVQDPYQGRGIGRVLLTFLETFLASKGCSRLLSSAQADAPAAQGWHRAVGFQECGILAGLNQGGIGEIFFQKALAPRGS
jgi:GNAT superfamily N-acetyltransferase